MPNARPKKQREPPEWISGGSLRPPEWQVESCTSYYLRTLTSEADARRIARVELLHVRAIRALREAETLGDLSLPPLIRAALDDLIPEALPDDFFYRLVRVEEELRRPGQPRRAFRDQLIRDLFKLYRRVGFDTSHGPMSQKDALKRLYDEFGAKNGWNSTDPIRKILKRPDDIRVRKSRIHKDDLDHLVSWIQTEVNRAGK